MFIKNNKGMKMNAVDYIFLFAVILIAAFIFKKTIYDKMTSPPPQNVTLKFYSEQIPSYIASSINNDDFVYDNAKNILLGQVKSVDIKPGYFYISDSQGALHKAEKEGYNSIELTAEIPAVVGKSGVVLSGVEYQIGFDFVIRAGRTIYYTKISAIEPK